MDTRTNNSAEQDNRIVGNQQMMQNQSGEKREISLNAGQERIELGMQGQVGRVGIRAWNNGAKANAKDLTNEIDRVTNIELITDAQHVTTQDRPMNNFVQQNTMDGVNFAQKVNNSFNDKLDQPKNQLEQVNNIFNNERNEKLVEAENELKHDMQAQQGEFAGEESVVQTQEFLRDDAEDQKVEDGKGWEHNILTKSQNRLTDEAVRGIEAAIKDAKPLEIERQRNKGMYAILETYGRKFGRAS